MSTILFFVRVNQVLVRLWTRAMVVEPCSMDVPLFWLMSDRESCVAGNRGMDTPKSGGESSETLCVIDPFRPVLLKGPGRKRVLCER